MQYIQFATNHKKKIRFINENETKQLPSGPTAFKNHLMKGPGIPFSALKQSAVSSINTGPLIILKADKHFCILTSSILP